MQDFTDITIVLDRSGSMSSIQNETIGGYNGFVKEQRKAGSNAALTLVQFDSVSTDYVEDGTPIKKTKLLDSKTFVPRGLTPLLDAVGSAIHKAGQRLNALPEAERPDKVVFVIITDGYENASKEYTNDQIKRMVEHQEKVYNWQFVYLGKDHNSFAQAGALGIPLSNTANYTGQSVGETYSVTSSNVTQYRSKGGSGQSLTFTDAQRNTLDPVTVPTTP